MTGMLWGGGFSAPPAEVLRRFNDSFSFDRALIAEDVAGSIAWATELGKSGVLPAKDVKALVAGLRAIAKEHEDGSLPEGGHEDIHSYVETRLYEKVGAVAGKLHTGRSRNDQVATDVRLYVKNALVEARALTLTLVEALAALALREAATAMPGYTHLKRAVPVTLGHWANAYAEMLLRDVDRFATSLERANECPLGSGALAGTPLAIDRQRLAASLGFARATANSLDGVSDRDAAADYLYASTMLLSHLSRLSEDLILWNSDELAFVGLPDALATGSSRMPQKKNPDVLELVRGHAGRAIGELTGLLAVLKGIPLAYDKDLQLDKEPLFRMRATLALALAALTPLIAGLIVHRDAMKAAASDDRLLTTELADALAARGVPFREAHEIAGKRIAQALKEGQSLKALGTSDVITAQDLEAVDVSKALARRTTFGGTAPALVTRAAKAVLAKTKSLRRKA